MTQPPAHNHGDERQAPGVPCFCQWCQQPVRRIDRAQQRDTVPVLIEEPPVAGLGVGDLIPRAVWSFHVPRCRRI